MALKPSKRDVDEYLQSHEDMALYLEAAMEEAGDDAELIAKVPGDIARAKGMTQMPATGHGGAQFESWLRSFPNSNDGLSAKIRR